MATVNTIGLQSIVFILAEDAMFQTLETDELLYGQLLGSGVKAWSCVVQPMHKEWLHVGRSLREGEDTVSECVLLPNVEALKRLLEACNDKMWITSVRVVSPGYLNGSADYRMDQLAEIRRIDGDAGSRPYIYVLCDGTVFPNENQSNLEGSELLFSASLHCISMIHGVENRAS
jgi:hypothetical protein